MKKIILISLLFLPILLQAQTDKAFTKAIKKHRKHYKKEFLEESRSPLNKKDTKLLRFFSPDQSFEVKCTFTRTPDAQPFDLATYSGITKPYVKYGTLSFELNEKEHQLAVYQSINLRKIPAYKDYLFIPFKDATNGKTTYGGGRYIDITLKDIKDGVLILDFNKAYNPWCAYSDGYNCPIPPTENHLEVAIEAGEKNWLGEKKKK